MAYAIYKFLHILGVILLLGNVTVTAFWKVFADRTGDPRLVAHAQYLVTLTDWFFTASGIILIIAGGYGMVYVAGLDPLASTWLVGAQVSFLVSGLIWLFVLVPLQIRQARMAKRFSNDIPPDYRRDAQRWLVWGIVATIPLVLATWLMVSKP